MLIRTVIWPALVHSDPSKLWSSVWQQVDRVALSPITDGRVCERQLKLACGTRLCGPWFHLRSAQGTYSIAASLDLEGGGVGAHGDRVCLDTVSFTKVVLPCPLPSLFSLHSVAALRSRLSCWDREVWVQPPSSPTPWWATNQLAS